MSHFFSVLNLLVMGATREGTRSYFETKNAKGSASIRLGRTGWEVSPVGFGGYRIHDEALEHKEALHQALLSGCNLIDTSTNYGDGHSELLVGQVLGELFKKGQIRREQVVVVSKAGYVQGSNMGLVQGREQDSKPFPEVVKYRPDCWHCISPEFLEDQLTRSLARLKLGQLDVLLLHNPEYFLKSGGDHSEYYERIAKAFRYLETEVKRGRIQCYGISSNSFPEPKQSPEFTSLEVAWSVAEEQGSDHHFSVIQFPMNLFEPGAALEINNAGECLVDFARKKNLGTLVNRPLNAFTGERMVRLADFPSHEGVPIEKKIKDALTETLALESSYPGEKWVPVKNIAWGHILRQNFDNIGDLENWKSLLAYRILPSLDTALTQLASLAETREWARKYEKAADALFESLTAYLESHAARESERVTRALLESVPALETSETLSRKAIRIYRSIPGIDCILVGMRHPKYVRDVFGEQELIQNPPLDRNEALRAFEAVSHLG